MRMFLTLSPSQLSFPYCKGQENRRRENGCENGHRGSIRKADPPFYRGEKGKQVGRWGFYLELILLGYNKNSRKLKRRRRELGGKKPRNVHREVKRRGTQHWKISIGSMQVKMTDIWLSDTVNPCLPSLGFTYVVTHACKCPTVFCHSSLLIWLTELLWIKKKKIEQHQISKARK